MAQPIQPEHAGLDVFPFPRDFERRFDAGIENRAELRTPWLKGRGYRRRRRKKIRNQRIGIWWENGLSEVSRFAVIGAAKSNARDDGKPAKVGVGVEQLMKRIEAIRAVILKPRVGGKIGTQFRESGLAFVEDWAAEKAVPLDIDYYFRQPFDDIEKAVELETRDRADRVKRIRFRQCDNIIRLRIGSEFRRVKIL